MGYQKQDIQLDTFANILEVLNKLSRKTGLRFDIEVKRPPNADRWTCSLTFDGNDPTAEHNADLCLFLERYAEERERLETYWSDPAYFDRWFDQELAYYAGVRLLDKEQEDLTPEERLKRRNELIKGHMEEARKVASESGEQ